jgi:inorganic pyrophosphatase
VFHLENLMSVTGVVVSPALASLPTWDQDGLATAIIETPKGSQNKLAYDPTAGAFRLTKVLPVGMSFPYDFGFLPGTRGEDGDPLDVLVFMDAPVYPGCLVAVRLVGVIEAEQRDDGKWARNDRLVGVAACSRHQGDIVKLADLGDTLIAEIEAFFVQYHQLQGHEWRATDRQGPSAARKLVDRARES